MNKLKKNIFVGLMLCFISFVIGCSPTTNPKTKSDSSNNDSTENTSDIDSAVETSNAGSADNEEQISKGPFTVECNELDTFLDGLKTTTNTEPYEIIVSHPVKGVLGPAIKKYSFKKKYIRLSFINYEEDSSINYEAYTTMDAISLNHSLISIVIPKTVVSIETNDYPILYGCKYLEKIEVEADNTKYSSKDGVLYSDNETKLIRYPECKKDLEFTMPDTVTYLDSQGMNGNKYLTKVNISSGAQHIDGWTFSGCTAMKEFKTDSTVSEKQYIDIDGVLFDDVNKKLIAYPSNKDGKTYTIPDGIKEITGYSFCKSNNLEKVVISNSVETIKSFAFEFCDNLVSIVIPTSVNRIDSQFCSSCDSLTNIYYKGTEDGWNNIEKSGETFYGMEEIPTIEFNYSD